MIVIRFRILNVFSGCGFIKGWGLFFRILELGCFCRLFLLIEYKGSGKSNFWVWVLRVVFIFVIGIFIFGIYYYDKGVLVSYTMRGIGRERVRGYSF